MATKDDVIAAWTTAAWPNEILQQMRNYLDANASNYIPASYDDIVNTGLQIGNRYFGGQSTALWSLTPSIQYDIGVAILNMWDRLNTSFTITTLSTGKWNWHMEYNGLDSGNVWIFYNTPSGEPTMMPALMVGWTLQDGYLPVYKDSNLIEYSWFADESTSGNPLQVGDDLTPIFAVTLYAGMSIPSKVIQMNNKIIENNNEVRYKIYPITKASAVLLDNGITLQEWNSEINVSNWIKRESDAPGVGNFISWNSNAQGVDSGKNASSFASNTHTHSEYAPLASPNFTGTPNVPLASSGDNSNQIASTNFVQNELLNHYGISTTAAGTTAKTATTIGGHFKKSNGNSIKIQFRYRNAANNITLNVDGTGASNVIMGGNNSNVAHMWVTNSIVEFIFDGTNYCMVDRFIANTTNYGLTMLVDSVTNTSNLYAATPNAVNAAYTLANNAYVLANDTNTLTHNTWSLAQSAYANANLPKIGNVTLNTTWTTNGTQYEKTVSITGLTANSQVDLTCNTSVINHLLSVKSKALYFENRNGTLYAVSVGNKPTQSLTVQYTMYTVS